MKAEKNNISVKTTESGAIALDSIMNSKSRGFWDVQMEQKLDYLKAKAESFNQKTEEAINLLAALDSWLPVKDRGYSCKTNLDIAKYLYAGDTTLSMPAENGKFGVSVIMAQAMRRLRRLNTMYYHYCADCADSYSLYPKHSKESRLEFCRIIIENVRVMLAEIWDYKHLESKLQKEGLDCAFIDLIESMFFYYESIKSPVRQAKILKLIACETALPRVADISKKYHIISSLLDEKFQDIKSSKGENLEKNNSKLINSLVDELSVYWLNHIGVMGLDLEDDASRFNEELNDIIENLTDAQLRACEKKKNMESGAKGRKLRKEFEENSSSKAVERFRKMRPMKLSIDGEENAGVMRTVESISSSESPYCPDDYSSQAWERFDYDQKLFLVSHELCSSLDSKTGFMGLIRDEIGAKSSYVLLNITRLILEEILGEKIEEVTAQNKKDLAQEITSLAIENSCLSEIEYVFSKLRSTKISDILDGVASDKISLKLKKQSFDIYNKLKDKKSSKTRN